MTQRSIWIAGAIFPLLSLVVACPQPGGNQNTNRNANSGHNVNANTAANNNANTGSSGNSNSNSSENVTLSIRFDVTPANGPFVRVLVFVNKGLLDRFDVGDGDPNTPVEDFQARFSQGGGGLTQSFPRGTQICLICDESEEISSACNNGLPPVSVAAQFAEYQGDTQGASGGADPGVLFFTLNENRTITARFVPMHAVIVRSVGGANGTGTNMDIQVLSRNPLTVPPLIPFILTGCNVVGTGLTGQQGQIGVFHFARDGTVIRYTVPDDKPFISFSGDGAIGGRSVTFTFGQRTQTADLDWP